MTIRLRLTLLAFLFLVPMSTWAQVPQVPNEGVQFEWDGTNAMYRLQWWGRLGRTYFIQHSEDLATWVYLPILEPGVDDVREYV